MFAVIKDDFDKTSEPNNKLFFQLSRITRQKGSLLHDDRLEALAMAVAYWLESLGQDSKDAAAELEEEMLRQELEAFVEKHGTKTRETWLHL